MRILVTGATGFIGGYVISELLQQGIDVVATSAHEEKAKGKEWFARVNFVEHDLSLVPASSLYKKFYEPDKMIHLAWQGLPAFKGLFHFEKNLPLHYNFLRQLISEGLKDLLVTGTCLEYGLVNGSLEEDRITNPSTAYGIAKDSLRKFLQQLQKVQPFILKWLRLFYMYGKGQNPGSLLPQLESALDKGDEIFNMSGGEQLRDFLPVEKVAEYIVRIALLDNETGIINCCSGKPVKVKQFVEDYIKASGKHIQLNAGYYPYPDYEPMEFWGDNSKLVRILNDNAE